MPIVFTELAANAPLNDFVRSPNSPFDPEDRYDLIDPRQMIDDINIRNDRSYSSEKIEAIISGGINLANYYNKAAIDAFFAGESGGKKLIDWSKITNKSGVDFTYIHNQSSPSATWTINHNLGYRPAVSTFDSAGSEMVGEVTHTNTNQSIVYFAASFSGNAYLS